MNRNNININKIKFNNVIYSQDYNIFFIKRKYYSLEIILNINTFLYKNYNYFIIITNIINIII